MRKEDPDFISFIAGHTGTSDRRELELSPIDPDGSQRSFFRISFGAGSRTFIAVKNPPSTPVNSRENASYLHIGRHLRHSGVPVPQIHGVDLENGWFLLEDLGDLRLQEAVKHPQGPLSLYSQALEKLLNAQVRGTEGFDPNWCCQTPYYDSALMRRFESDYFREAFLRYYLQLEGEFRELDLPFDYLAETAGRGGTAFFLHRDFQSRNIMVKDGLIGIIDWQGARLGPLAYDVASLLVDPYSSLSGPQRKMLYQTYADMLREQLPGESSRFEDTYPYLAIQRNLQILGAFSFLSVRRGKLYFKKYIPPAMDSLVRLVHELGDPRLLPLEDFLTSLPRPWEKAGPAQ